jgi:hypothetical protein
MGAVVEITSFLESKIATHRLEMQRLMVESWQLVDQAVHEGRYDFSKITRARDVLDKAVWHNNEIKRLEAMLHCKIA